MLIYYGKMFLGLESGGYVYLIYIYINEKETTKESRKQDLVHNFT